MQDLGFAELVDRAGRGEGEAVRRLIERYESAVRRQIRFALMDNKLRRVLEETDVCQSVMGQFFSGLRGGGVELDSPEQMAGLLRQMVRNKIIDRARYWRAGRRDYLRNLPPGDPDDRVEPASTDPSPSRVVEDSDYLTEFESRLSEWERTIYDYRRQGMSWPEIAGRTGVGAEAIRKRFERAVERVARSLGTPG
jgi:RNA polymerase sigma factor (sigma-70 family)